MNPIIDTDMLWRQYGAAIDMLGAALRDCPDALWEQQLWADHPDQWVAAGFSRFWYLGYHTLFWLDLYLTGAEEGFAPPAPFDLVEMEAGEVLPRTYSRAELLGYLDHCRRACQETLSALSAEQAGRLCRFAWGELTFAELQLYNLRHVQEHAAHLGMFLGQQAGKATEWKARASQRPLAIAKSTTMILEFSGKIWYWRGPAPHHFVTVPPKQCADLKSVSRFVTYGWGMIPVTAGIGQTRWKTSLFPKDGGYIVPINLMARRAEALEEGDTVAIQLEIR